MKEIDSTFSRTISKRFRNAVDPMPFVMWWVLARHQFCLLSDVECVIQEQAQELIQLAQGAVACCQFGGHRDKIIGKWWTH